MPASQLASLPAWLPAWLATWLPTWLVGWLALQKLAREVLVEKKNKIKQITKGFAAFPCVVSIVVYLSSWCFTASLALAGRNRRRVSHSCSLSHDSSFSLQISS